MFSAVSAQHGFPLIISPRDSPETKRRREINDAHQKVLEKCRTHLYKAKLSPDQITLI